MEVVANSVVGSPTFRHTTAKNDSIINEGVTRFTFTYSQASDINPRYQISTGSTASCNITSVSIRPATEEVVTERVDLSGLEGYLEEITPAKPYIYPYGGINNQATSVDGIATTVDNVRPITYFANFDGDTTSRGRGWNLNDLTDAQLLTILQNPDHHVYVIDGRLVQFRFRPRQIKGAGNGDWENFDTTKSWELNFGGVYTRLSVQGTRDSIPTYSTSYPYISKLASTESYVSKTDPALFYARKLSANDNCAYNGECYFYVLATVLRLNQGAYHLSLNPLGAKHWNREDGDGGIYWYSAESNTGATTVEAFKQTTAAGEVGARTPTGTIGQASSRPDGRFYDAIYADSVGGVIDRRLSALPITIEDYFKAIAKAENGTMRGMEKLVWTKIDLANEYGGFPDATWASIPVSGGYLTAKLRNSNNQFKFGSSLVKGFIVNAGTTIHATNRHPVSGSLSPTGMYLTDESYVTGKAVTLTGPSYLIITQETNLSVSGNFLQTDVIGNPANIMQIDALKDGWLGGWISQIPDGTLKNFSFTRKNLDSGDIPRVLTTTNGVTWGTPPLSASFRNVVTNSISSWSPSASTVLLLNYTASAKMTKPSAVLPVLGDEAGFSSVRATSNYWSTNGFFLAESLMGKVTINDTGIRAARLTVSAFSISGLGTLNVAVSAYNPITHAAIPLSAPSNNSPAIKFLPHAASINGQATLGFVWNEIKHDGASWNDDGQMRVIDGIGTYNNLKPESCLYGYAVSALPIGWVDNHARFGAQVPGVDL
ncbi:hypothetical protein [Vibrio navarrensis]|uniref:hypothetical protein n=1 Tax=Vibrio navarrensis TaxID=29495 RepID=UPI0015593FC9|nr:hypothetical protein [Vibrio navarrensis]